MLDTCSGETQPRMLVEGKPLRFSPIRQRLPLWLREKDEPKMTGIDSFLNRSFILNKMPNKLVTSQTKCERLFRSAPDRAPKSIHIELERGFDIVNR